MKRGVISAEGLHDQV